MYRLSSTQKKILLILLGGIVLGTTRSPTQYYRALRGLRNEWHAIDQGNFNRAIRRLSAEKLFVGARRANGSFYLTLTREGKKRAEILQILGNTIRFGKQKKWDGLWRVVIFDIPEKNRNFRGVLRDHLREIGFYKLQQSVFVFPYSCEKQISDLVALYGAERHIHIITATMIDNDIKIKKHFFGS